MKASWGLVLILFFITVVRLRIINIVFCLACTLHELLLLVVLWRKDHLWSLEVILFCAKVLAAERAEIKKRNPTDLYSPGGVSVESLMDWELITGRSAAGGVKRKSRVWLGIPWNRLYRNRWVEILKNFSVLTSSNKKTHQAGPFTMGWPG